MDLYAWMVTAEGGALKRSLADVASLSPAEAQEKKAKTTETPEKQDFCILG